MEVSTFNNNCTVTTDSESHIDYNDYKNLTCLS